MAFILMYSLAPVPLRRYDQEWYYSSGMDIFMSRAVKYLKDTNVSLKNYGLWKIIFSVWKDSSLFVVFW